MQEQEKIEGLRDLGDRNVVLVRLRKHHVQEVVAERQFLLRKHERQTFLVAVDHRDHGADLGDRDGGSLVEDLEVFFKIIVR